MTARQGVKQLLFLLCCFIVLSVEDASAQDKPDEAPNAITQRAGIYRSYSTFDKALVNGDTAVLNTLLHEKLSMGHSNGMIENKEELLQHISSGFLKYERIEEEPYSPNVVLVDSHKLATVRRKLSVRGALNGAAFEVKLSVMEVWVREGEKWQLLCRQSIKIN